MSPKTKEAPAARPSRTPAKTADAPAPTMTPQGANVMVTELPAGAPELSPPEGNGIATAQAAATAVTAWQSVTVGGLYTTNNVSNAWAYLNGLGWRKVSPANAVAHATMLQMLRLARDGNLTIQCDEDGSLIHTIYIW
jgi:hypothetical protein